MSRAPMPLWEAMHYGAEALGHCGRCDEDEQAARVLLHWADVLQKAQQRHERAILEGTGHSAPVGILNADTATRHS